MSNNPSSKANEPPPPLDDPTVKHPLECPPLSWGILGCGRVCHDFTQALKNVPTATVVACAARDINRSKEFAKKHKISKAYGNYNDLVLDESIQCIYVGTVHAFRKEIGEMCLMANKHVVLEKPFACSYKDAQYLINLAKERNLFIMEGLWTRFFPAVEQARRLAFGDNNANGEGGKIGEIAQVISDFNINASDDFEYPTDIMYNRKLGGGASYLVGPYPISAATLFFNGREPDQVHILGQKDDDSRTGVDLQVVMTMTFPPTTSSDTNHNDDYDKTVKLPGAGMAICSYGTFGESSETTTIIGTKGRIIINTPGHCPTTVQAYLKSKGRGNVQEHIFHYPLPEDNDEIIKCGRYNYPNSAGFAYEAAAVARCIHSGKTETPQFTLKETLLNAKLIDIALQRLDIKPIDKD